MKERARGRSTGGVDHGVTRWFFVKQKQAKQVLGGGGWLFTSTSEAARKIEKKERKSKGTSLCSNTKQREKGDRCTDIRIGRHARERACPEG